MWEQPQCQCYFSCVVFVSVYAGDVVDTVAATTKVQFYETEALMNFLTKKQKNLQK